MNAAMPRFPRPVIPGQPMHIVQRGNNRTRTFIDRQDCRVYLDLLQLTRKRTGCAIHAYVLMRNHVHLLVTPDDRDSAARMMQGLGRWYVRYFNRRHGRTGTLWEGRYRSTLIDTERYFFACSRYIELNPVRAGIVATPGAFAWSSFRGNAIEDRDRLLTHHALYHALGKRSPDRQAAYRALFDVPLDATTIDAFRRAARRGVPLGDSSWIARLEARLQRRVTRLPHGGIRRGPGFVAETATSDGGEHHRISTTLTP